MTISVKPILKSMHPHTSGRSLYTIQARYPNIIHGEVMTHRVFSRNASSNRAIPVERMLADIERDPFIPSHWGKAQKGMQAGEELPQDVIQHCRDVWMWSMDKALFAARCLIDNGLHKQIANRILQPYGHMNVVITSDEWANFETLRIDPAAEPHMEDLARTIQATLNDMRDPSNGLQPGMWHLPYVEEADWREFDVEPSPHYQEIANTLLRVSAARCARVSYLTHDGRRTSLTEDHQLAVSLLNSKHMSPFEHQATPDEPANRVWKPWAKPWFHGNFVNGWCQHRKMIE